MKCNICPRECGADRENGQFGVCGVDNNIYVARVGLHMWEEPCISGNEGSGTVFFAGCSLGCIYCQNYKISRGIRNYYSQETLEKKRMSVNELSEAFILLQSMGANNINLVTPTHYSIQIIEAVRFSREKGLNIPIVYNCSGYEKVETLSLLSGIVDIYLTDFKYMNNELANKYSHVSDYVEIAKAALEEMVKQQPACEFDSRGMMTKGVIVRNLLLPGNVNNSKEVAKYVYDTYGDSIYLSIMNQYTPLEENDLESPLDRKVTKREYERLIEYVISLDATNVFIQEGDVASESFIPEF